MSLSTLWAGLRTQFALARVAQVVGCHPGARRLWFSSHPGHVPGMWAWSPVGRVQEAANSRFFFSLSLPLSQNKKYFLESKRPLGLILRGPGSLCRVSGWGDLVNLVCFF